MRLLRPEMATWLLAIPPAVLFWFLQYRYKRRFRAPALEAAVARLSRRTPRRREVAVLLLSIAALGLLAAAMMRPQLRLEERSPTFARRDLILVLDRSVSMRARDIRPSRFARAIEEVQNFLKRKPEAIDRVALIGFASTSIVLSYPTDDLGSLFFYLEWMRDDPTPFFGTDIAAAVGSALSVARRDPQRVPPVLVVISDGEDQGPGLERIAAAVTRGGMRVHCVGIGSDQSVAMPLPAGDRREEFLRDDTGQIVLTRFDEGTLRRVAALTGGRYFRSVTGTELRNALDAIIVADRPQTGWKTSVEYRELYPLLLGAAAVMSLGLVMRV